MKIIIIIEAKLIAYFFPLTKFNVSATILNANNQDGQTVQNLKIRQSLRAITAK